MSFIGNPNNATSITLLVCISSLIVLTGAQEKFTLLSTTAKVTKVAAFSPAKTTSKPITTTKLATTAKAITTKVPYRKLVCPKPLRIPIFSLPCEQEKDCRIFGSNLVCCQKRCIQGVWSSQHPKRTVRVSNEISSDSKSKSNVTAAKIKKEELICPSKDARIPLFSLPCRTTEDCKLFGRNSLCCRNRCLQGVLPPKEEVNHAPTLFGLVDRMCPAQPLAELLDVKECEADADCTPRICCPEKNTTTRKSYCRTPIHKLDRLPGAKRIEEPLRNFVSYMQCTPPPPSELFPKPCNNTLDCFPNLCCLENGKKHCRPPRRSIISWVADVGTRVGAVEATRKFIERITA